MGWGTTTRPIHGVRTRGVGNADFLFCIFLCDFLAAHLLILGKGNLQRKPRQCYLVMICRGWSHTSNELVM